MAYIAKQVTGGAEAMIAVLLLIGTYQLLTTRLGQLLFPEAPRETMVCGAIGDGLICPRKPNGSGRKIIT